MSELNTKCLDAFPEWLKALPEDALELSKLLANAELADASRRHVAGALNYLFKSLDLIPDGIEDLGFLDDAFVLRVASRLALDDLSPRSVAPGQETGPEVLLRLAGEAKLVEELLGKDFTRLAKYTDGLVTGAARGRTPEELLADADVRQSFLSELEGWAQSYQPPSFSRDEKNLVKLTSFLSAKLPG
jgi:uncharacterized membrane protein YkvA (DUF1232 family)